ncbi:PAS domain-containing serine/threonine-protein kinase [Aphelenchoides besseyi]|nr:PAS domain-containing serine/threonine-protein kinase [Aphelenchoides besseyi]
MRSTGNRRSFHRRRILLTQKSEPSDLPEDHVVSSPSGHEQNSVSYFSLQPPIAKEPLSPAAKVLGHVFTFNDSPNPKTVESRRRSQKGKPVNKMTKNDRRRSSIAQTTTSGNSFADTFAPTSTASSFYTSVSGGNPQTNNAILSCLSSTANQNSPTQTKNNRRKAVITLNPETTEILIANDNLRRLFALDHDAIIGKQLTQIFPPPEEQPNGLHFALFDRNGKLKSVYGKPVDIRTNGELSTVCLWSYALTAAPQSTAGQQRRSAILSRSPSAYLPNSPPILNSTPLRLPFDSNNANRNANSKFLNVLHEEEPKKRAAPKRTDSVDYVDLPTELANASTSSTITTTFDAPKASASDPAVKTTTQLRKISPFVRMESQDDEEPPAQKLGAVQRSFRKFDFRDLNCTSTPSIPTTSQAAPQLCDCKNMRNPAITPLNPHHNAQHSTNHHCNDATNCRWLILMEPINALHINVILGAAGRIFRTDDSFAAVLGYDCTNRLFGTEIRRLIPGLKTGPEVSGQQQQCCGCSVKRNGIPFSAIVVVEFDNDENPISFDLQIRSLAAINGVLTITDTGVIHSFNENFLNELTGREIGSETTVMLITDILPGFYEASSLASLNAEQSDAAGGEKNETVQSEASEEEQSERKRCNSVPTIQVGAFYGLVKHTDGILIPVRFDVTRLDAQPRLFAVGIGYERGMDYGINQSDEDVVVLTRQSSSEAESEDFELRTLQLADPDDEKEPAGLEMRIHDVTLSALADESNEAVRGRYSAFYDTFQLIGNGTFGSVKLAARKDSGLLAVTKFVCKDKVLPESWVRSTSRDGKMIPIEVHLLETLNHRNIVKVLDVFENDKYYQLVMEKLGCGMDLFEFIESHPAMDEELISYIFRQIVDAVEYLHQNFIVHRDLKDENVIIDGNFCCKLIDFGSAAYFGRDIVFSTFCGTMEYCSPEVLTGNKYLGPEVEMWSMGILLYTLVFFQNPFRTPQETVHADFEIPWTISDGLFQVISSLLTADPKHRATITATKTHWWVRQTVDTSRYKFREVVRNSERARVSPPLYVSDLHNHLKNASSCGNLANNSTGMESGSTSLQPQESGIVSAR